ncbi:CdaR family transcriptional regulator [Acetobacterium bakii]|uniref:Putative sugar diacid recognition domain-containing protein n=1 Tax=Acetobacterium bakii TaxID=52689 RepID=A0A0L6U093_9FIRM|nr:sugar diacid recognition domain-containing protein [Acetobacterium bakii]KNZ41931.1 hypothetical protein AKG39_09990 [Acetobacterium bakii]
MIDKSFAEKFIEEIRKYSSYNFLVFNRKGIILAATEKDREGAFHEASYSMMQENKEMIIIQHEDVKNYLGVKCGIDIIVSHNHNVIGAIGITGLPEEVHSTAMLAKMTFEVMFDYDNFRKQTRQNNNKNEEFYGMLLASDPENTDKLNTLAKKLDIKNDILRIPIAITTTSSNENIVLTSIQKSLQFTNQDFAFISRKQTVVVFKSLNEPSSDLFKEYRTAIFNFLFPICKTLEEKNVSYNYYVGSFQKSFNNYHFAYKHCLWLIERHRSLSFFYDYVDAYIQSVIPMQELNGIYQVLGAVMDESMRKDFFELFTVLRDCNYNLVDSSRKLYIHKNTLIFRLSKYKNFFGFNPLHDAEDRAFANYLCNFINLMS